MALDPTFIQNLEKLNSEELEVCDTNSIKIEKRILIIGFNTGLLNSYTLEANQFNQELYKEKSNDWLEIHSYALIEDRQLDTAYSKLFAGYDLVVIIADQKNPLFWKLFHRTPYYIFIVVLGDFVPAQIANLRSRFPNRKCLANDKGIFGQLLESLFYRLLLYEFTT